MVLCTCMGKIPFVILFILVFSGINLMPLQTHAQFSKNVHVNEVVVQNSIPLVWEATNSYTPPLYQGKKLRGPGGSMKMVALLPKTLGDSSEFMFLWREDGEALGSLSGIGKDSVILPGNILQKNPLVSVDIINTRGVTVARGAVPVPETEPLLLVYKETPLSGIDFSNTVSKKNIFSDDTLSVTLFPYFFSTQDRNTIDYYWTIGEGGNLQQYSGVDALFQKGGSGQAHIDITAQNEYFLLDRTKSYFSLTFE